MRFITVILILLFVKSSFADTVRVHILSRHHPQTISISTNQGLSKLISIEDQFPIYFNNAINYTIEIKGILHRSYLGSLSINRIGNELQIINELPLEDYVASVVLSELGWHPEEAMRAQAILARTWAIMHMKPNQDFDFDDLTNSQVYKGLFSQTQATKKILEEDLGKILVYKNAPLEVVYHANCGNQIYSAYQIWGGESTPYLANKELPLVTRGTVKNDWVRVISLEKLSSIFSKGKNTPEQLHIRKQNKNDRLGVRINKNWLGIDNFRLQVNRKLGWNTIPSNEFSLIESNKSLYLKGKGLGHLVGLCQRQSIELAKQGWKSAEILQFFYPGSKLHRNNN